MPHRADPRALSSGTLARRRTADADADQEDPMAAGFRCSQCERDLRAHCPEGRCNWWRCTNRTCDAATYDVTRGILIHVDGRREQLGSS